MKEKDSQLAELTALRNDLHARWIWWDSREAAELFLQVFLMGRGYGVSPQAAFLMPSDASKWQVARFPCCRWNWRTSRW